MTNFQSIFMLCQNGMLIFYQWKLLRFLFCIFNGMKIIVKFICYSNQQFKCIFISNRLKTNQVFEILIVFLCKISRQIYQVKERESENESENDIEQRFSILFES